MNTALPADFCPAQPVDERVARYLLTQLYRKWHYELVDEDQARAALSAHYAGHQLQNAMEDRDDVLQHEVSRVAIVRGYLMDAVGLTELNLALAVAVSDG